MFQRGLTPPDPFRPRAPLEAACTQDGMSLLALGEFGRLLLVFVPALGSMFTRELLARVQEERSRIETLKIRLVIVHMGPDADAESELARFDLQYLARVEDPERELYRHFELGEASVKKRLHPAVLSHAIGAVRHGRGRVVGSTAQLPGAVLLSGGEVEAAARPELPGAAVDLSLVVPRS
ncbi:MAG: hypothetical protein ACYTGZ_07265 [Planctomycetota bacterium]